MQFFNVRRQFSDAVKYEVAHFIWITFSYVPTSYTLNTYNHIFRGYKMPVLVYGWHWKVLRIIKNNTGCIYFSLDWVSFLAFCKNFLDSILRTSSSTRVTPFKVEDFILLLRSSQVELYRQHLGFFFNEQVIPLLNGQFCVKISCGSTFFNFV